MNKLWILLIISSYLCISCAAIVEPTISMKLRRSGWEDGYNDLIRKGEPYFPKKSTNLIKIAKVTTTKKTIIYHKVSYNSCKVAIEIDKITKKPIRWYYEGDPNQCYIRRYQYSD